MTETLDGRVVSAKIRGGVTEEASLLRDRGIILTLAVVVATDEEASHAYVRAIARAAQACGIETRVCDLGRSATSADVGATVRDLAADGGVHGIIVQTPLPQGVVLAEVTRGDGRRDAKVNRVVNAIRVLQPANEHVARLAGRLARQRTRTAPSANRSALTTTRPWPSPSRTAHRASAS